MSFRSNALVVLHALMLGMPVEIGGHIYMLGINDSGTEYFIGTTAYTMQADGSVVPVVMVTEMSLPAFIKMTSEISDADIFALQSMIAMNNNNNLDN